MFETWSAYKQYTKLPAENKSLVIYSEGTQYWRFFAPIVKQLSQQYQHKICYVSSDKSDPGLTQENTIGLYVGEGFWRTTWFHTLQAKVVLMTMPDLHISHLKRSRYPVHYCYLFHSLMSVHLSYLESAFDYYDTIFCATQYHIEELRRAEQIYATKKKQLIQAGYPLLDDLLEQFQQHQTKRPPTINSPQRILYAPSWGEQLSLVNYGQEIIQTLLDAGKEVIFRPHPHSFNRDPKLMQTILQTFQSSPLFCYTKQGSNDDLFNADLLITDWSGIGFEFAFVMKKPIIFIDTPMKIRNPNYRKLNIEPFESRYRNDAGEILNAENIPQINALIDSLLTPSSTHNKIQKERLSSQLFNLSASSKTIANELIKLTKET